MSDAKTLQVSEDGINFYTMPGNTADINFNTEQLDDTIFGSNFASSETGLINWDVSGNAMYRGQPGYVSIIRRNNALGTAVTDEPMTQVDTSQTYEITDATKNAWDFEVPVVVKDDGTEVADTDIADIDYLFGRVTFVDTYTPTGAITVDVTYFTMATYGRASEFTLTQTADTTDTTAFEDAQANGGFNEFRSTLQQADLSLSGFYRETNKNFDDLKDRDTFVIELDVAGDGTSLARGIYKVSSYSQSGDVGGDESSDVSLTLKVPEGINPMAWKHTEDAKIPKGLLVLQNGWAERKEIDVRYFPEGPNKYGYGGKVIVTDCSVSSGVNAMVEASVSLQGTGTCSEFNEV